MGTPRKFVGSSRLVPSSTDRIARQVRGTWTPRVLGMGSGAAVGLFALDYPKGLLRKNYREPVLVSCAEGLGAKLDVAFRTGVADTVGRDLVARCVNGIVAQGAEPLFFLDHLALGGIEPDQLGLIVGGIAAGCREADCVLFSRGEGAERPGLFRPGSYDLAGFAVGVGERARLLSGGRLAEDDDIIGLASAGIHSSGYSLVRKIFLDDRKWRLGVRPDGLRRSLGEELLEPTRIYVRPVQEVLRRYSVKRVVHALAHISGAGLTRHLAPLVPANLDLILHRGDWPIPPIFHLIRRAGALAVEEMFATFNMGVGMAIGLSPHFTDAVLNHLARLNCPAWRIGHAVGGKGRVVLG